MVKAVRLQFVDVKMSEPGIPLSIPVFILRVKYMYNPLKTQNNLSYI